jgi:hypothetical protein
VGEEGHHRVDRAPAEGIVTEVKLNERGLVFEGIADCGERERDLGYETASKYVCKVGDLASRWVGI